MGFCSSGRDEEPSEIGCRSKSRERGVPTVPAGVSRSQIIAKPNTERAEITVGDARDSSHWALQRTEARNIPTAWMLELENGNWGKEKRVDGSDQLIFAPFTDS
jgi:hypothetical protein